MLAKVLLPLIAMLARTAVATDTANDHLLAERGPTVESVRIIAMKSMMVKDKNGANLINGDQPRAEIGYPGRFVVSAAESWTGQGVSPSPEYERASCIMLGTATTARTPFTFSTDDHGRLKLDHCGCMTGDLPPDSQSRAGARLKCVIENGPRKYQDLCKDDAFGGDKGGKCELGPVKRHS